MNLQEIEKTLRALKDERARIIRDFDRVKLAVESQMAIFEGYKALALNGLKVDWFDKARDVLRISGIRYIGSGETLGAIDDAIGEFVNGFKQFKNGYIGCKNYEGFHCQRSDHPRGYGPRHGSTVFEIDVIKQYEDLTPEEIEACIYTLCMAKQGKLNEFWTRDLF